MKTFQSQNKKPYCKPHLPKLEAQGGGADSLENQRLQKVSNQTSMINYKADFEKAKGDVGSFGQVGLDSPDMKINMRNSDQISGTKYNQLRNGESGTNYSPASASTGARFGGQSVLPTQNSQPRITPPAAPIAAAEPEQNLSVYHASFAYNPDADDELAFEVGDAIIDAQLVAEGWLYGTNQRTGASGLVPEPYCTKG